MVEITIHGIITPAIRAARRYATTIRGRRTRTCVPSAMRQNPVLVVKTARSAVMPDMVTPIPAADARGAATEIIADEFHAPPQQTIRAD